MGMEKEGTRNIEVLFRKGASSVHGMELGLISKMFKLDESAFILSFEIIVRVCFFKLKSAEYLGL
jgi:hypothetical protein